MIRVLFVCTGNVCRSPMARGVFERALERAGLSDEVEVDAAGTHAFHLDAAADPRAQEAMARRGIDISDSRARRLAPADFRRFDYLIAMDMENYRFVEALRPQDTRPVIRLFMEYAPHFRMSEIPDPYYGSSWWFDRVLDMIDAAAEGLMAELQERLIARVP
jgi:low molecular weight protein-tyrosine phosphatase